MANLSWFILLAGHGQGAKQFYEYIVKDPTSGPRSLKCTICGKLGTDRSNLRKHVESIHFPGVFSYTCKHCSQTFNTKNLLNHHMKTHNVVSYWINAESVSRGFYFLEPWFILLAGYGQGEKQFYEYIVKDLSSGPRSHKCTICGKLGTDRSNMRKHVESMHFPGVFSYNCKFCSLTFNTRNLLNLHIKTHKTVGLDCKIWINYNCVSFFLFCLYGLYLPPCRRGEAAVWIHSQASWSWS